VAGILGIAGESVSEASIPEVTAFANHLSSALESSLLIDKLRKSEEKFSKAFKTSPDAVNINRLSDGVYLDVNDAFTAITGYTQEDVIGRSSLPGELGIWAHHGDRNRLVAMLSEKGEATGLEAEFRCKDGRILSGVMSARVLEINGEKCILSITRDITQRKVSESALKESEKRFRDLVNFLPLAIFEATAEGWFTFVNPTGLKWFGYSETDVARGIHIFQTITEKDRASAMRNFQQVMKSEESAAHEYQAVRKDGSTFPVFIHSSRIVTNGRMAGLRGIVQDISEHKFFENNIQNAMKMESLGVLAGGIAHDFNNLLTGIFGYLSLAGAQCADGTDAKANITKASSVFGRATALTQQLLTFAKGRVPERKRIQIAGLLAETVRFALSGSVVKASFDIPENLWPCDADAGQIGQVIDNIVINARQAMPTGGSLSVSVRNVPEQSMAPPPLSNRSYLKITLADTGHGIPPDVLARIFDPFFTTKQQGSGLGLATAYSIVKKHDGHIFAESTPGKGTTFTIYLPAATIGAGTEAHNVGPNRHAAIPKKCRVLLMDDEEYILAVASQSLQGIGWDVVTAPDGKRAVELFRNSYESKELFDVVVLDLTVPGGMGGVEAVAEMLRIDAKVKTVATSGYSDDPVMAAPATYGFSAKLPKPYLMEDLRKVIAGLMT
jgi:PAS domain S-box-containing protein